MIVQSAMKQVNALWNVQILDKRPAGMDPALIPRKIVQNK
jgi:hypothetical protein